MPVFHESKEADAERETANKLRLFSGLTFSLNMVLCPVRHILSWCH